MKIGFVGIGHMGSGMAADLLKAGDEVTVYNRTPAKAAHLAAQGAKVAITVADACRGDAVFTMLANDEAVESLLLEPAGILTSLAPGALHVSSSTISLELSQRLSEAHRTRGQRYVAAPVFGRPEAAAAAALVIAAAANASRRGFISSTCPSLLHSPGAESRTSAHPTPSHRRPEQNGSNGSWRKSFSGGSASRARTIRRLCGIGHPAITRSTSSTPGRDLTR